MITNFETNKVFLAQGLSSPVFENAANSLVFAFHDSHVNWAKIPSTHSPQHIWVRDYMPVQVSKDRFIQFRYEPDYLMKSPAYKPDVHCILSHLGINACRSPINLDGGNIISCGDKVIMTDKIFSENPQYSHNRLIEELTELLEAEPVLIPWDIYEEYGHADGMVRYMGSGNVLLNNYCDFDKALRKKLLAALNPHFNITELHYGTFTDKSWAYLNFLHVGHQIFVPMTDDKLGEIAFRQIAEAFPTCECHSVQDCKSVVNEGGALNCCTWNILMN